MLLPLARGARRSDRCGITGRDQPGCRSPVVRANLGRADKVYYSLRGDTSLAQWRAIAKDGADLPRAQETLRPARLGIDVGETYDFAFTPTEAGEYILSAPVTPQGPNGAYWRQRFIVR